MNSYIFIGRSGCGKGTQADLLIQTLKAKDEPVFYIETGNEFRNFVKGENFSNKLSQEILQKDRRQPDFLACFMWSKILIEQYSGESNLVFDGVSRSLSEARVLDTALEFYSFKRKYVVYLDVSRKWSEEHLLARGRSDDATIQKITKRLDWFDSDVLPAVEYYKNSPVYQFIKLNGERPIQDIHNELIAQL